MSQTSKPKEKQIRINSAEFKKSFKTNLNYNRLR